MLLSGQMLLSLEAKANKYEWANNLHLEATRDRSYMATTLFQKLCSLDPDNYYSGLYDSETEEQLSDLVSNI